jgi:hypothetical protein
MRVKRFRASGLPNRAHFCRPCAKPPRSGLARVDQRLVGEEAYRRRREASEDSADPFDLDEVSARAESPARPSPEPPRDSPRAMPTIPDFGP